MILLSGLHSSRVEYAHNTLTSSATGLSPFEASLEFQPPLFPVLEQDLAVPSIQHHLQRSRRVWEWTRLALRCASEPYCQ